MDWKTSKAVVVPLIFLVIGIWGYVAHMLMAEPVAEPASLTRQAARQEADTENNLPGRTAWKYQADFRDPFRPEQWNAVGEEQGAQITSAPGEAALELEAPRWKILGLAGRTALVDIPGLGLQFVRAGDRPGGVVVERVTSTGIRVRVGSEAFELPFH
jgi:hypothetical protein